MTIVITENKEFLLYGRFSDLTFSVTSQSDLKATQFFPYSFIFWMFRQLNPLWWCISLSHFHSKVTYCVLRSATLSHRHFLWLYAIAQDLHPLWLILNVGTVRNGGNERIEWFSLHSCWIADRSLVTPSPKRYITRDDTDNNKDVQGNNRPGFFSLEKRVRGNEVCKIMNNVDKVIW